MSAIYKIYLTLAFWVGLSAFMFFYGFNVLGSVNVRAAADISRQKSQLLALQAQQQSYLLSQRDLQQMQAEKVQPEDFFSVDITLVKEIQTLEDLGKSLGVNLTLGGISGIVSPLPKGKSEVELYTLPYSISVSGTLEKTVDFIETLEHLGFITTLNSLSLSSSADGTVSASMGANFYIRKQ
jgi:Tfp pilus assembly protein PilO